MYKSLLASLAVVLACAGVAFAAGSGGPSTKPRTMVLRGTTTVANVSYTDTTGACNVSAWVDQCSETTGCSCYEVTSPTISGSGAKGATVHEFFVTIDGNVNPAAGAVDDGPNPKCYPFYGFVALTDKDGNDTTANLMGVLCKHVKGISKNQPAGNYDQDLLLGGWGIASSTPQAQSGWGTFTGKQIKTSGALSLQLKGWITK